MDYLAGQYSISKIDTPLSGTVLMPSQQQDFLALSVAFTSHDVITAVLNFDNDLLEKIMDETMQEQEMSAADGAVLQSVPRLFEAMNRTKNATEAAAEVGYESLSQFIRDYRKMFGAAPKEDILTIQKTLKK